MLAKFFKHIFQSINPSVLLLLFLLLFFIYFPQPCKSSSFIIDNEFYKKCPLNCTCSYEIAYCNDLIDSCVECEHWSQVDFNRIVQFQPESFKFYTFSPNKQTEIFIYRLLNNQIETDTFKNLYIPDNSHVEFTFQYNSIVKFNENSLNGIRLGTNSTLIINLPFITQVYLNTKFFQTIQSNDKNSKIIIRILKSYIVKFISTTNNQNSLSLKNFQFIIDIKSTYLVKFDENAFSNINMQTGYQFYIDFEFIEKLYLSKRAFTNLTLTDRTNFFLYFKQINKLSLQQNTFENIQSDATSNIYLIFSEVLTNFCFKSFVFSNLWAKNFNLTILNSKNLLFNTNSFYNVDGVTLQMFNSPSRYLLEFNKFLYTHRRVYLYTVNTQIKTIYYYYNTAMGNTADADGSAFDNDGILYHDDHQYQHDSLYLNPQQMFTYNLTLFKNAFKFYKSSPRIGDVYIYVDNIQILYLDVDGDAADGAMRLHIEGNVKKILQTQFDKNVLFYNDQRPGDVEHSQKFYFRNLSNFYCSVSDEMSEDAGLFYNDTFFDLNTNYERKRVNGTAYEEDDGGSYTKTFNYAKLISILILTFICVIILFMIILNIIQYKYRDSPFDDYDSTNGQQLQSNGAQYLHSNGWKRSFSLQSLRRTLSTASLRRPNTNGNKREKAALNEISISNTNSNTNDIVNGQTPNVYSDSESNERDYYEDENEIGNSDSADSDEIIDLAPQVKIEAVPLSNINGKICLNGLDRRLLQSDDLGYCSHE